MLFLGNGVALYCRTGAEKDKGRLVKGKGKVPAVGLLIRATC
jgi:hypothetical protein